MTSLTFSGPTSLLIYCSLLLPHRERNNGGRKWSYSCFIAIPWLRVEWVHCAYVLSHVWLFGTPWTVACQASLSMGFPRQEYWSGWPLPPPGDLPSPGIRYVSLVSPALRGGFFTRAPLDSCLKLTFSRVHFWEPLNHFWDSLEVFLLMLLC